ncbi:MAG: transporter substrate-binding protein, partial [Rhizobacter sp.]|nr:transporter substrate-binding protein [Rhizobacter sp.]
YQTSPFGIVSLVDGANIQQPKDMIGKRIGLTSLPIDQLQFNAMIEKAGIKRSQIEVVNPGFSGGDLVGQRKLDGASGVPWYEIDGLKSVNLKPTMMLYRDHLGLEFPFLSLIVNAKYAQDHGDTIKAYLRAVKKGAEYTKANPDEALDILLKTVPSLDRKRQAVAMQTVAPLRESPATAANGAGYVDVPQIQKLADFLLERGALKTKLDASATFTNQYR